MAYPLKGKANGQKGQNAIMGSIQRAIDKELIYVVELVKESYKANPLWNKEQSQYKLCISNWIFGEDLSTETSDYIVELIEKDLKERYKDYKNII